MSAPLSAVNHSTNQDYIFCPQDLSEESADILSLYVYSKGGKLPSVLRAYQYDSKHGT